MKGVHPVVQGREPHWDLVRLFFEHQDAVGLAFVTDGQHRVAGMDSLHLQHAFFVVVTEFDGGIVFCAFGVGDRKA